MEKKIPLGIYIHIPFCVHKCNYCDFLSFNTDEKEKKAYISALIDEIKGRRSRYGVADVLYNLQTIYIGGGTPSCIDVHMTERILECIFDEFDIADPCNMEITIEVNPGTVTNEKLSAYKEYGINRLSIGLQSVNDNELKALGRIHSFRDFVNVYRDARDVGYKNINVDIMMAIPYQTMDSLMYSVDTIADMSPEHISAYSLIIEEGTPFYEKYGTDERRPVDEDTERMMYHETVRRLKKYGYSRYEISNFAIPDHESRHNISYWKRRDYFGFGLGASSFIGNIRYKNTSIFKDYVNHIPSEIPFEEKIKLTKRDRMEEFMFLGLRMSEGVSANDFEREFGVSLISQYGREIKKFTDEGLLVKTGERFMLTDRGIDYGNHVFSGFLG
ncbi:MAG: oxygen-independent coproporphyrinogen III oxidase [Lachnospiraceae bacterium]|nr:oxygen-independent coproporphyrinogen III oxidase [Lachnospiraceae bacterium]